MKEDRPGRGPQRVVYDPNLLDDECIDYLVVVPINSTWFNKINENELIDLPPQAQEEIVFMLGELTLKSIIGLNETSYDDIDIAKAYHLLTSEGYTVTQDNGE